MKMNRHIRREFIKQGVPLLKPKMELIDVVLILLIGLGCGIGFVNGVLLK